MHCTDTQQCSCGPAVLHMIQFGPTLDRLLIHLMTFVLSSVQHAHLEDSQAVVKLLRLMCAGCSILHSVNCFREQAQLVQTAESQISSKHI